MPGWWGWKASPQAQPIEQVRLDGPLVLVVGNEGEGMRPLVRKSCDVLVRLPMLGKIEIAQRGGGRVDRAVPRAGGSAKKEEVKLMALCRWRSEFRTRMIPLKVIYLKIDLHVHASERSGVRDFAAKKTMIRPAMAGRAGRHWPLPTITAWWPPWRLAELNALYAPFRIYPGIEITADDEDWLVIGVQDPALESEDWHYPALAAFARTNGRVHRPGASLSATPAHPRGPGQPARRTGSRCSSINTPREREGQIRKIAAGAGDGAAAQLGRAQHRARWGSITTRSTARWTATAA